MPARPCGSHRAPHHREKMPRPCWRGRRRQSAPNQLDTLRYSAEGTGYTFGQAYHAGGAWPKITCHSLTRAASTTAARAMRDGIVLSRAEPLGGGGYPLSGQQRNDQFVSGELAWNRVRRQRHAVAARRWSRAPSALDHAARHSQGGTPRQHQRAHGRRRRERGVVQNFPGGSAPRRRSPPTAWYDASRSIVPDPVLGDTAVVTTYDDYRDFGAIRFPMRIRQTMGGYPVLDLTVKEVQVNPALALATPEGSGQRRRTRHVRGVAEGVWFLAGGSHNSVLIELQDRLVLVETPLNDAARARGDRPGEGARARQAGSAPPWSTATSTSTTPVALERGRRRGRRSSPTPTTWRTSRPRSLRPTGSCRTRWRAPGKKAVFQSLTDRLEDRRCAAADQGPSDRRQPAQREHRDGLPAPREAA